MATAAEALSVPEWSNLFPDRYRAHAAWRGQSSCRSHSIAGYW